jgi:hypothetical protein
MSASITIWALQQNFGKPNSEIRDLAETSKGKHAEQRTEPTTCRVCGGAAPCEGLFTSYIENFMMGSPPEGTCRNHLSELV